MDKQKRDARELFMAIAIVEHHQMLEPKLSTYDICDLLGEIWVEIENEAKVKSFTLDADCILEINKRVTKALNAEPGMFRNKEDWLTLVDYCRSLELEGDSLDTLTYHTLSWMFSSLYWNHLTHFKLATVWLYINALRLQYGFPEYRLSLNKLGAFLESLSGSGPPLYDGQTFYPGDYS